MISIRKAVGVLIGGRGNQDLMETKNKLHKIFHIMY